MLMKAREQNRMCKHSWCESQRSSHFVQKSGISSNNQARSYHSNTPAARSIPKGNQIHIYTKTRQ